MKTIVRYLFFLLMLCIAGCQDQEEALLQEKLQQAKECMASGNNEKAMWILKEAEEHISQPSNTAEQIYSSLSKLNHQGGDYEKAILYQDKATAINQQLPRKASISSPQDKSNTHLYFAKSFEVKGQTLRAETLYVKAIQASPTDAYFAYLNLAELYDRTQRTTLADSLLQTALQAGIPTIRQAIYQALYQRCLEQKDTARAIQYIHRHTALTDSLSQTNNKENILIVQAQYEQEVIARQKAEMQRNYLLILIGASLSVGIIAYRWRKKIAKERAQSQQALQVQQEATKEKEIKINHLKAIQGIRREGITLTGEQIAAFDYYLRFKANPTSYSSKEDREKLACWLDMVHNNFATRLKNDFPELTPRELDICYLHRLGYSTWDIKEILGMAQLNSVTKAISRTCSKLNLDTRQKNLSEFILNF